MSMLNHSPGSKFNLSRRTLINGLVGVLVGQPLLAFSQKPLEKTQSYLMMEGKLDDILSHESSQTIVWIYTGLKDVYLVDFSSLLTQGRTFNRLTHLIQQSFEPYKRILSEQELEERLAAINRTMETMAFGHDILFDELVLFYNLAKRDNISLFAEEQQLLDFLIQIKAISEWRGIFNTTKPNGVILSAPKVQTRINGTYLVSPLARKTIIIHELSHGEYYTNPYYAEYCRQYWSKSLNDSLRSKFLKFLEKYNYSLYGMELVINEMQAYLMFTPDPNSFNARTLGVSEAELRAMRTAFVLGKPPTHLPLNLVT
ncbi:MAG TPA: hypothetical protein PK347_09935 [Burkholderiaceae bacterium]|nr:hypothetical protein [Burkholderiaceae bacterium]